MSRLFAIEAESFLEVFISFFVGHGIDSGSDNIDVHGIQVSVRRNLCRAPRRAFISFLNSLSEVSVSIVIISSVVLVLCRSSVSVDLIILDSF